MEVELPEGRVAAVRGCLLPLKKRLAFGPSSRDLGHLPIFSDVRLDAWWS